MKKIITAIAAAGIALGLASCGSSPQPYYDERGYFCERDDMEPGDRGYVDKNGFFCERDDDGE